ncbi:MAG: mannose-1-phosphate guanylyltransferase [Candidatus Omnitrophota bacterium]|nr:mannose-1-phosphate guanylyltransferase [Candidatus Omnitrophota bacterium]
MSKRHTDKAYAVILVGGKGKRLAPISTAARPKAFLPITKRDETMFKKTLDRVKKFIPKDHIVVVANKRHANLVKIDFPDIARGNLILEPLSRNTAPAIALAASAIKKRSADAVMMVLSSDHYISGDNSFISSLLTGVDFVRRHWRKGPFVVVGIKPRFPATGFGYIKLKPISVRADVKNIYEVDRFVEKPDLKTARDFLKAGRYMWNAGIFIFKASLILKAIDIFEPAISYAVKHAGEIRMNTLYKKLPDISIDYAVMEKADAIYCVKGRYGWQDIGDPNSLREVLEGELKGLEKSTPGKNAPKKPLSMAILERLRAMRL